MALKVPNKKLTLLEKLYILEVAKGLWITISHFFRNITLHILHLFGIAKDTPAAVTYQYPEESHPLPPRMRTLHRLTKREDGSPRCVACMMCETICPADCIYIVAGEHPDPLIEKYPTRFEIDVGRCIFCGYCVEACPEDAIRMDTGILTFTSYTRSDMIHTMEMMLARKGAEEDGEDVAGAAGGSES